MNIINYGHMYDHVFNWGKRPHIGKMIYTGNQGDRNIPVCNYRYHAPEAIGELNEIPVNVKDSYIKTP